MIGTTLGPFRIVEKLGQGGMGVVYRAEDTRLGREVAIKTLPERFVADAERLRRFEREAKVLASLNHPRIAAIYEVGEDEGTHFLVMELASGETLTERIARGPIPPRRTVPIALQIAEAIEAAHDRGIVHRDLKPSNVKLDAEDNVKVLDFGLAKAVAPISADVAAEQTHSPTLTIEGTRAGVILGTAAYMSPEQARGKEADERSDLWSFGAVLWEMLTGRRLFEGKTVSDTLAAVLRADLEWEELPDGTPVALRRLLRRCLAREPGDRLHHAADARLELQEILAGGEAEAPPDAVPARRRSLFWALAAGLLAVAAFLGGTFLWRDAAQSRLVKLSLPPPEDSVFLVPEGPVTLSPDGRQIAAVVPGGTWGEQLAVRGFEEDEYHILPNDGSLFDPFWSPDARSLGFFNWDGTLRRVGVGGGPPIDLAEGTDPRGATWNADDVIVFAPAANGPLYRVSAGGGEVEPVTSLNVERGETGHWRPHFLPDGRRFLYLALTGVDVSAGEASRAASRGAPEIGMSLWVGSLDGDPPRRISGSFDSAVSYAPPGHLLFLRDRTLMTRPFDLRRLDWRGEPQVLEREVDFAPEFGTPGFSVSSNGMLAYHRVGAAPDGKLVWRDRTGALLSEVVVSRDPGNLDLAPDGRRAAVRVTDRSQDIWIVDLERGGHQRLTFSGAQEDGPVWSPDGQRIAFMRTEPGRYRIVSKAASGAGDEVTILEAEGWAEPVDWSADGKLLLVEGIGLWGDLWVLPVNGEKEPVRFVSTVFGEHSGRFSPDGRWVAYVSNETERQEIYVQPWPPQGDRWQISTGGGEAPRWRGDGQEIYYVDSAGRLVAVPVSTEEGEFDPGLPRELFEIGSSRGYEPSRDGERFLITELAAEAESQPATVVLNWPAMLDEE